ncbi:MAG: amidohydrolase [Candidatus Hadarchaeum yellowstonense]|uniref:Amidohydrolase n=1 Tax=Hadarchaeum yellowstonense TaxID=1776334 RepID=A0A147JSU6_HADYE|nr:MAG: amidohydrolase [Candidatus Hadarchaeum yellowstonense]
MNQRREIIQDGAVVIEENRIVDVGKTKKIKSSHRVEREIDCRGKLVLPGLVDCHVHLAQALIRGCADDMALIPWLRQRVLPLQGTYTEKEGELSAKLCCIEMIKSGTTTFVECLLHWRYGFDRIARVVEKIGIRGVLSKSLMNVPGYADQKDAIPSGMVEDGEKTMKQTIQMIQRWHGKANNRIHVWFGARTPGACTVDFYREISEKARKYKTGITIHLAEVKQDIEYLRREFGMTPMEFMNHCGIVGPHVIYAHGVWIPPEDFKILQRTGGTVCHCPASNLKLASGFAPVPEMLKSGVNVALGCDGGPSNNCYDMIREMKLAALVHKARLLDPEVLPAETVLEMATLNGAKATLWRGQIGSIERGKLADLIVIDLRRPHLVPVRNPVSNLVYAANGGDVDTVIIDGKIIMENRQMTTIEEEEVVQEAIEAGPLVDQRLGLKIGPKWPLK